MSMLVAITLATVAVAGADEYRSGIVWLGVVSFTVLAAGIVFASPIAVGAATAGLGLSGIIATAPAAPLYALGLFVTAETALWSADDRFRLTEEIGLRRDRLLLLAAIGSSSIAVGAMLRLLARDSGERNSSYTVIAGVSLVALAGLIAFGARRRRVLS
ncbi:MAG TPA: hypothetical protein VM282_12570 [Acidimicrobiales bacterium]|nr:hypothetical protein [Acidimicrobiales bacterium]